MIASYPRQAKTNGGRGEAKFVMIEAVSREIKDSFATPFT